MMLKVLVEEAKTSMLDMTELVQHVHQFLRGLELPFTKALGVEMFVMNFFVEIKTHFS